MSANEQQTESRSSVKLIETAKDVRVELKVYAGDTAEMVDQARIIAQEQFLETVAWLKSVEMRVA